LGNVPFNQIHAGLESKAPEAVRISDEAATVMAGRHQARQEMSTNETGRAAE
jgi:hypothetical protein